MTPIAAAIAKQFTLPIKKRDPKFDISWHSKLPTEFKSGIHCFECSGVLDLAGTLARSVAKIEAEEAKEAVFSDRVFLPAPRTWLEFKRPNRPEREAVLLIDREDGWADAYWMFPPQYVRIGKLSTSSSDFDRSAFKVMGMEPGQQMDSIEVYQREIDTVFSVSHFLLMVINSPRIIGRRQHMPNRGLERRLTQSFGVGKFPLHGWTEIELCVTKPIEIDDGEPHEAHITGRRALHFCRAHIRIRNGKLEYVTSHWRGDPAIGIKQSRYKVVA